MKPKITERKNADGSMTFIVSVGRMSARKAKKAIAEFIKDIKIGPSGYKPSENFYLPVTKK